MICGEILLIGSTRYVCLEPYGTEHDHSGNPPCRVRNLDKHDCTFVDLKTDVEYIEGVEPS